MERLISGEILGLKWHLDFLEVASKFKASSSWYGNQTLSQISKFPLHCLGKAGCLNTKCTALELRGGFQLGEAYVNQERKTPRRNGLSLSPRLLILDYV